MSKYIKPCPATATEAACWNQVHAICEAMG
jgi:hypothetical protein